MNELVEQWGLDSAEIKDELIELATSINGFSTLATPHLHNKFKWLLYVGYFHNLTIESDVSKLSNIKKQHGGAGAMMQDYLYMYKVRQAESKAARASLELRCTTGCGSQHAVAKEMLQKGKGLVATTRNRPQKHLLIAQVT